MGNALTCLMAEGKRWWNDGMRTGAKSVAYGGHIELLCCVYVWYDVQALRCGPSLTLVSFYNKKRVKERTKEEKNEENIFLEVYSTKYIIWSPSYGQGTILHQQEGKTVLHKVLRC